MRTATALSTASANIANVNTIGYKAGHATFSTLLASALGSADISSAGVTAVQTQNVSQQGLLQTTNSPTDLAISGNGFFVVNNAATAPGSANSLYYTRAGNFTPDANGDLRNVGRLLSDGLGAGSDWQHPVRPQRHGRGQYQRAVRQGQSDDVDHLQGQSAVEHGGHIRLHRRRHECRDRDAGLPAHDQCL